jgi:hypothetical protein
MKSGSGPPWPITRQMDLPRVTETTTLLLMDYGKSQQAEERAN